MSAPVPTPVVIPGLNDAPTKGVGIDWVRSLVVVTMLAVLLAVGFYVTDNVQDRRASAALLERATDLTTQAQREDEWLKQAVAGRRVILGMTPREVVLAKGEPRTVYKGDSIPADQRARGAVEAWIYPFGATGDDVYVVLFGVSGLAIFSSDVGFTPYWGSAIRQP